MIVFFFSSRRRHTRYWRDWSSDVCSSDLIECQQVAVETRGEYESGCSHGDSGNHRRRSLVAPSNNSRVRINGRDPALPALVLLAKSIGRAEELLFGLKHGCLCVEFQGGAPIDAVNEAQVGFV